MAHNPDNRRGARRKHKVKNDPKSFPLKASQDISHNGLYPYMQTFLEWGSVKGLSDQTTTQRNVGIRRWIVWCDERGLDDPRAITKPILERYQKHLYYYRKPNGEPLAVRSQASLLLAVRSFFKWLSQTNRILYNPASDLEMPKIPPRLPQVILSVEEVERVLSSPKTDCHYGVRDRAILETFYSTGIRKSECANLGLYDVDSQRKTLIVRKGKGGKDRVLPLGDRALYWIEKYRLESRQYLLIDPQSPTLFISDHGEPMIKNRISDMVKRYLYHAEIDKPGACHLFRHAMATHMLDNGADLRFIQMMLGHSDLSTTEIYTHVSIEKLREVHAATHPARLEKPHTSETKTSTD